ncbi:MAG TPA: DNA-formamidopyrimidine glycosylase family protein [Candidatus Dormibacteraeota bacterium]|nr:DNA-formamidopyrimidine glycosylase family protein [Candidatus Dormibacteraeota bacterium]
MPELVVLRERLTPLVAGQKIAKVSVSPKFGFLLRTPPADLAAALEGNRIDGIERRGKFLVFDAGQRRLVLNPMLGGRLHLGEARDRPPAALFALELEGGRRLSLTDFARMARVYLVDAGGLDQVPGWSELGPEAEAVGWEEFQQRIRKHPGELKNLLRNQAFLAGVGNAYSDEILHAAGLLPLRKRPTLRPEELRGLYDAIGEVLGGAVAAIRAQPDYQTHKQDRSFMRVHMRGGQPCPRCGHRIAEIKAGGEITNFCRGCQR